MSYVPPYAQRAKRTKTTEVPKPAVTDQAPAQEGTIEAGVEHVVIEFIRLRFQTRTHMLVATLDLDEAEELYALLRRALLDAGRRPALP